MDPTPAPNCSAHRAASLYASHFKEKVLSSQDMPASQHYLLQLVGLGLVFVTVGILAVGHAQAPHSQDAVDVIPHPGILLLMTGRQQPCDRILLQKRHKMTQQHSSPSS